MPATHTPKSFLAVNSSPSMRYEDNITRRGTNVCAIGMYPEMFNSCEFIKPLIRNTDNVYVMAVIEIQNHAEKVGGFSK